MISIIITVIAILLVAAILVATVWYGGDLFPQQSVKAEASRLVNESSQIKAAAEYFRLHNSAGPSTLQQLEEGNYLKQGLTSGRWQAADGYATVSGVPDDRCLMANKMLGVDTVPSCDDPAYAARAVCCTESAATP